MSPSPEDMKSLVPLVPLDPKHPLVITEYGQQIATPRQKQIEIPQPSYRLEVLVKKRMEEHVEVEMDSEDQAVFDAVSEQGESMDIDIDVNILSVKQKKEVVKARPRDDWQHDPAWIQQCVQNVMPLPTESSMGAAIALQRQLRTMLREQETARSLKDLGWYMPEQFIGDNLFQWIVELHSFDEEIPIAKDMKAKGLKSVVFEITKITFLSYSIKFY